MLSAAKRSGRKYINRDFEKAVREECMLFKSVPMSIANKMLTVPLKKNDFTGIKQVYQTTAERPVNIIAMAQSISRITDEPLNIVAKRLLDEQRGLLNNPNLSTNPILEKIGYYERKKGHVTIPNTGPVMTLDTMGTISDDVLNDVKNDIIDRSNTLKDIGETGPDIVTSNPFRRNITDVPSTLPSPPPRRNITDVPPVDMSPRDLRAMRRDELRRNITDVPPDPRPDLPSLRDARLQRFDPQL
jgi:hypothetical protein